MFSFSSEILYLIFKWRHKTKIIEKQTLFILANKEFTIKISNY